MSRTALTLVGDGIENPWNAQTLRHAAAMFESPCVFRDRGDLVKAWTDAMSGEEPLTLIDRDALAECHSPIVAFDNGEGAESVYGFRMARATAPAVVLGNERHGIGRDIQAIAHHRVDIPMVSRRLNCLNVAAAGAVALYYLSRGGGGKLISRSRPESRRPELLLLGAADHVELGSTIRSAGAFGWARVFLDDRQSVWFGRERRIVSEGRAAARQQRNPIRVVPLPKGQSYAYAEACVVSLSSNGVPLQHADLSRGPSQLIIFPDESAVDLAREDWGRFAKTVRQVQISVPGRAFSYHYRLIGSIALAEIARQVGRQPREGGVRSTRGDLSYGSGITLLDGVEGETVFLEDLTGY